MFKAILAAVILATAASPQTREAKYAMSYPKGFHDNIVKVCVEELERANPNSSKQAIVSLCDCTFWLIEDTVTFQQFLEMDPEKRQVLVVAAVNGCAIKLSEKEKK